ncbi:MAG: hypothetical protein AAF587_31520 [Bacteroidota bacterium]
MRGFLRKLAIFFSPFLLGGILLFVLPYETEFAYSAIEKHCRNGNWIQHRLFESSTNIDVACIGTSRTMCGISDHLLEQSLARDQATMHVANLGFARLGRSLHYAFAKALLTHHQPKVLIVEVQTKESRNSHLDFPYVANASDVLLAPVFMNGQYAADIFTASKLRFFYWRARILGEKWTIDSMDIHRTHSFILGGPHLNIDSAYLRPLPLLNSPKGLKQQVHRLNHHYPYWYLAKIKEACDKRGVALRFLYLPNCNDDPAQLPIDLDQYREWATVWMPPDTIIHQSSTYMDPDHLNETGATQLTEWLAHQIAQDPAL